MQKNVICLKVGTKYSSIYVNTLYNMCRRNITGDFRFICFTDDKSGIYPDIECFPPPTSEKYISGWFYKLSFFQEKLINISGDILYLDLDVVIVNPIDEFFLYPSDKLCIIEDWLWKKLNQRKYNSSVMKWRVGEYSDLFSSFIKNYYKNKKYTGDQDFITDYVKNVNFWPDDWCASYKLNKCFDGFKPENKIIIFHGKPNPDEIKGGWVRDYWC